MEAREKGGKEGVLRGRILRGAKEVRGSGVGGILFRATVSPGPSSIAIRGKGQGRREIAKLARPLRE